MIEKKNQTNKLWSCVHCLLTVIETLTEDTSKLQKDIDQMGKWARKWGVSFQPVKCNIYAAY